MSCNHRWELELVVVSAMACRHHHRGAVAASATEVSATEVSALVAWAPVALLLPPVILLPKAPPYGDFMKSERGGVKFHEIS